MLQRAGGYKQWSLTYGIVFLELAARKEWVGLYAAENPTIKGTHMVKVFQAAHAEVTIVCRIGSVRNHPRRRVMCARKEVNETP